MKMCPLFIVNAFTHDTFGGNPAAICLLEEWLANDVLQKIAAQHNLSETAFLVPSPDGASDYDIRWFTPTEEVDLCGHATLASAFVLFEQLKVNQKSIVFQSRVGTLVVVKDHENKLIMDFPQGTYKKAGVLGTHHSAFGAKPVDAYTCPDLQGEKTDLLLVFEDEMFISHADVNFKALTTLNHRSIIITAPSSSENLDFVCRVFAPKIGISEDPVTGSAFTILAPFWKERLQKQGELSAKQTSLRGGEVWCRAQGDRVFVSGFARLYAKADMFL